MGWNKNPSFVQTQINAATIKISSDQNINDDSFRRLSTVAPPFLRYVFPCTGIFSCVA